jgi:hypothetical protein
MNKPQIAHSPDFVTSSSLQTLNRGELSSVFSSNLHTQKQTDNVVAIFTQKKITTTNYFLKLWNFLNEH